MNVQKTIFIDKLIFSAEENNYWLHKEKLINGHKEKFVCRNK